MPTYEYTCRDCGHTFDIVQKMIDASLTTCPRCGGTLRKVFGAPAIAFKGSGFYATDHGKGSKAHREGSDAKPDTKPDTKPETKPDTKKDAGSSDKKADTSPAKGGSTSSGSTPKAKEGSGS